MQAPEVVSAEDVPSNLIRVAGEADFLEILRLARMLHEENGQHAWSDEKAALLIWRGVKRDNAIIGVIGPSTDIRAMIMLVIDPVYYSEEFQLHELFAFTRPDSRKTDYAKRLIIFAKECAKETGLDLLIGIISDERLKAKARLYARLLPKGGEFFLYRPAKDVE